MHSTTGNLANWGTKAAIGVLVFGFGALHSLAQEKGPEPSSGWEEIDQTFDQNFGSSDRFKNPDYSKFQPPQAPEESDFDEAEVASAPINEMVEEISSDKKVFAGDLLSFPSPMIGNQISTAMMLKPRQLQVGFSYDQHRVFDETQSTMLVDLAFALSKTVQLEANYGRLAYDSRLIGGAARFRLASQAPNAINLFVKYQQAKENNYGEFKDVHLSLGLATSFGEVGNWHLSTELITANSDSYFDTYGDQFGENSAMLMHARLSHEWVTSNGAWSFAPYGGVLLRTTYWRGREAGIQIPIGLVVSARNTRIRPFLTLGHIGEPIQYSAPTLGAQLGMKVSI